MTFKKTYWLALTKSKVDDTKVVEAFLYLNFSNNRSKQSAKTITFTDLIKVTEMIEKQCPWLEPDLAGGWGASWGPPPGGGRWWPRGEFAGLAPCSPGGQLLSIFTIFWEGVSSIWISWKCTNVHKCKIILYHILYRWEQEEHIWNTIITLYDVADSMF